MDTAKSTALKQELASQPEPQIVPITRFFDGNDDLGSIGCNLIDHPGIDRFRDILTALLSRPDVEAVYAQISELDPGEEYWPFADTVLVVGSIPPENLQPILAPLQPDEVGLVDASRVPPAVSEQHKAPVCLAWWD